MPNREVNLNKRVETPKGGRYCGVVFSANGRVKPDIVIVDGREEHHPEGAYYLSWHEGPKHLPTRSAITGGMRPSEIRLSRIVGVGSRLR
jgi:hypothetical protein